MADNVHESTMKGTGYSLKELIKSIPISLWERGMSEALDEFEQTEDGEEKRKP